MPKTLYGSDVGLIDAGIIYDQTEEDTQENINASIRSDISDLQATSGIVIQDEEPGDGINVWIDPDDSESLAVPSLSEFNDLADDVSDLENEIIISDTQPTETNNKLWVKESSSADGISIPTMDDIDDIEDEISAVENTLNQFDQNMAYVESGNTASRTYSAGVYISWKGTLYKANAAIPQGTAFSSGSGGNLSTVVDSSGNLCGGLNDLRHSVKTLDLSTITPTSRLDIKSSLDDENIYTFPKTGYFMFSAKTSGLVQVGLAIASGSSYLNVTVPAANSFVIFVIKNMNAKISSANYANLNYAFFLPLDD